jgi:hypothetical protein
MPASHAPPSTSQQAPSLTRDESVANERDKFLIRRKLVRSEHDYGTVLDEHGRELFYVGHPKDRLSVVVRVVAFLAGLILIWLLNALSAAIPATVTVVLAIVFLFVFLLSKRGGFYAGFYADKAKSVRVLEVRQDKFHFRRAPYTVTDADGHVLARFRKRWRWYCDDPNGGRLLIAKRRAFATALVILDNRRHKVGALHRKFTLFGDRCMLDMTADSARRIDRRIALAFGVMLRILPPTA